MSNAPNSQITIVTSRGGLRRSESLNMNMRHYRAVLLANFKRLQFKVHKILQTKPDNLFKSTE